MVDITIYVSREKFRYLVVEVFGGNWYGFDLKSESDWTIAENIVTNRWEVIVVMDNIVGWNIAKDLPISANNSEDWLHYATAIENNEMISDELDTNSQKNKELHSNSDIDRNFDCDDDGNVESDDNKSNEDNLNYEYANEPSEGQSVDSLYLKHIPGDNYKFNTDNADRDNYDDEESDNRDTI